MCKKSIETNQLNGCNLIFYTEEGDIVFENLAFALKNNKDVELALDVIYQEIFKKDYKGNNKKENIKEANNFMKKFKNVCLKEGINEKELNILIASGLNQRRLIDTLKEPYNIAKKILEKVKDISEKVKNVLKKYSKKD